MYRTMRARLRRYQLPFQAIWQQTKQRRDRVALDRYYHQSTKPLTVRHDEYLTYMAENVQRQRPFKPVKSR